MIDISKLKAVVFDFDDTLAIHSVHASYDDDKNREFFASIMKGHNWWDNVGVKPSAGMQKFIDLLKRKNIKLYLCSHVMSNVIGIRKVEWVASKYGVIMGNLCVSDPKYKVHICTALADCLNINRNEILLVDDFYKVTTEAEDFGICAASPLEAVEYAATYTEKKIPTYREIRDWYFDRVKALDVKEVWVDKPLYLWDPYVATRAVFSVTDPSVAHKLGDVPMASKKPMIIAYINQDDPVDELAGWRRVYFDGEWIPELKQMMGDDSL